MRARHVWIRTGLLRALLNDKIESSGMTSRFHVWLRFQGVGHVSMIERCMYGHCFLLFVAFVDQGVGHPSDDYSRRLHHQQAVADLRPCETDLL